MPQLDFNVAFLNLIFLTAFFIFFYLFIYFFVLQRLFKMIVVHIFFIEKFKFLLTNILNSLSLKKKKNCSELKKFFIFYL